MSDLPGDSFTRLVADISATNIGNTFNFLRDEDSELDLERGAAIRRANLVHYLESRTGAAIVGLGEAAGYAGARWSGIAFTSERTLASWGASYAKSYAPSKTWTEQAATIVHGVLGTLDIEEHVLLWNTVPTHPHKPGRPLSNRSPSAGELATGAAFARRLVELVGPTVVVAIGRLAERALEGSRYVRHPSNGGAAEFEKGMREIVGELRRSGRLPPAKNAG